MARRTWGTCSADVRAAKGPRSSFVQPSRCASSGSPVGHEPEAELPELPLIGGRGSSLAAYWPAGPPLPPAPARPRPPGSLAPSWKGTWKCGAGADVALGGAALPGGAQGREGPSARPWSVLCPSFRQDGLLKYDDFSLFLDSGASVARLDPLRFQVEGTGTPE